MTKQQHRRYHRRLCECAEVLYNIKVFSEVSFTKTPVSSIYFVCKSALTYAAGGAAAAAKQRRHLRAVLLMDSAEQVSAG